MNTAEKSEKPIPKIAESRISDLFSVTSSSAAKGNASRWYAEMMIDLFLSEQAKSRMGEKVFQKLNLPKAIDEIRIDISPEILQALQQIKDFGDKASHYHPTTILSKTDADRIVELAVDLIIMILADEIKSTGLDVYSGRATIFSTLLPYVRERVLSKLMNFSEPLDQDNRMLLHRFCFAATKNSNFNKARRKLDELLKKNFIDGKFHQDEIESIKSLSQSIRYPGQPIPRQMEDVVRNFNAVMAVTSKKEQYDNRRLITIMETLLEGIQPSAMITHQASHFDQFDRSANSDDGVAM